MDFSTPAARLENLHAALAKKEGLVVIAVHDYPDPDCLAAAMGVKKLLAIWSMDSVIAYGGGIGRSGNKAMIGLLDIELVPFSDIDSDKCRGAILVDTQPGAGNSSLPPDILSLAVLDHHPFSESDCESIPCCDVRTEFGSSSTLVLEYLEEAGAKLDDKLATALYLGIKTDTDSLERNASPTDVAAWSKLLPLVDLSIVRKIFHAPLDDEYFALLRAAVSNTQKYGEALVSNLGEIKTPDLISVISDMMVDAKGVAWALSIGHREHSAFLSLRIRPPRKNAGNIIMKTVAGHGTGGGHALAAGGQIPVCAERDINKTVQQIIDKFLATVGMDDQEPRPLVPTPISNTQNEDKS